MPLLLIINICTKNMFTFSNPLLSLLEQDLVPLISKYGRFIVSQKNPTCLDFFTIYFTLFDTLYSFNKSEFLTLFWKSYFQFVSKCSTLFFKSKLYFLLRVFIHGWRIITLFLNPIFPQCSHSCWETLIYIFFNIFAY